MNAYLTGADRPARRSANRIKTICFLVAAIPLALILTVLTILCLLVTWPLMIYSFLRGKQGGNPWRRLSGKNVCSLRNDS